MHHHLEIILPPTAESELESRIERILAPFEEGGMDEDGDPCQHPFWDWWTIGGRWSGTKAMALLDPSRVEEFRFQLIEQKITVSSFQSGKERLDPPSQQAQVDRLWREWFPGSPLKTCPLFEHAGDRLAGDVMRLGDVNWDMRCDRIVIAHDDRAITILVDEIWNGVDFQKTTWDGTIRSCVEVHKKLRVQRLHPAPDWLAVTVDYHS